MNVETPRSYRHGEEVIGLVTVLAERQTAMTVDDALADFRAGAIEASA